MKNRFYLATILICLCGNAVAEQPDPLLPEWLQDLPQLLEESSETSRIYLKNYLQCMDDQQALKSEPGQGLGQTLENALASSNACSHLLRELLQQLSEEKSVTPEHSL